MIEIGKYKYDNDITVHALSHEKFCSDMFEYIHKITISQLAYDLSKALETKSYFPENRYNDFLQSYIDFLKTARHYCTAQYTTVTELYSIYMSYRKKYVEEK